MPNAIRQGEGSQTISANIAVGHGASRALRIGLVWLALVAGGCAHGFFGNDPYALPEVLKAEMERAQQSASTLRAEMERLQNELAVARIAKAQLEGSLRDAERRVSESRQVIEFQREELSRARSERERVLATGKDLQAQLTSLQAQLAEQSRLQQQLVELVNRPRKLAPAPRAQKTAAPPPVRQAVNGVPLHVLALQPPPELPPARATGGKQLEVRKGDTLHSISRQYRVSLAELAALNKIEEPDRLLVGQVLMLPSGMPEAMETAEISQEAEGAPPP
jgi:LysM repeat protein